MLLERTILQLDTGPMDPDAAQELGQLGYMQWIASLPGTANYCDAALAAFDKAQPFMVHSPAMATFCDLLLASVEAPLTPLPLAMPPRARRGGARGRRSNRLSF